MQYPSNRRIPNMQTANNFRVTNPDQSETIRQRLYDFQLYPAAGQQEFSFFAQQTGAGKTSTPGAVAGSAKLLSDTNMVIASQLPSGMSYIIESIEVVFQPGSVATADTFTPATPMGTLGAIGAGQVGTVNDTYLVYNTGLLSLKVLEKNYLREPLLKSFPPKTMMRLDSSIAGIDSDLTTTSTFGVQNLYADGRAYFLEPEISLQPATNFGITIGTPVAQALPSGFNGRIGIILDGYMIRAGQ